MENIQYIIVNVLAIVLEGLSILMLFDKVFERKFNSKYIYLAVVPYAVGTSMLRALIHNEILSGVAPVIILMSIVFALYDGSIVKRIFYSLFIYVLFLAIDFVLIGVFMLVFKVDLSGITENSIFSIFATLLAKIILFILIKILCRFTNSKNKELLKSSDWIAVLMVVIVTLITIAGQLNESIEAGTVSAKTTAVIVLIVCLNIALFSIVERMMLQFTIEQEKNNLKQQVKLEMKNIELLRNNHQKIRELSHNLTNSLTYIKAALKENQSSKAIAYIDTVLNEAGQDVLPVNTNNLYIDTILAQKYARAQSNKINMKFEIGDLSNIPIDNIDLVTILSSALDNSIEACLKVSPGTTADMTIFVKIVNAKGQVVISVKNPVSHTVDIKNNTIPTGKEDKENHGIGLSNIKNTVNKYNGDLILSCESLEFRLTILFNTIE